MIDLSHLRLPQVENLGFVMALSNPFNIPCPNLCYALDMISERDYLKMRSEIENRCRLDIEALDRVWAMAYKGVPPPQKVTPHQGSRAISRVSLNPGAFAAAESLNKRAVVRAAVQSLPGEFGSKDVRGAMDSISPEASRHILDNQLSSNLAKLVELGEIHVRTQKVGRTPAVYAHGPKPLEEIGL
jgi:hypothetical protein